MVLEAFAHIVALPLQGFAESRIDSKQVSNAPVDLRNQRIVHFEIAALAGAHPGVFLLLV